MCPRYWHNYSQFGCPKPIYWHSTLFWICSSTLTKLGLLLFLIIVVDLWMYQHSYKLFNWVCMGKRLPIRQGNLIAHIRVCLILNTNLEGGGTWSTLDHLKRKSFFTFSLYNFCVSTLTTRASMPYSLNCHPTYTTLILCSTIHLVQIVVPKKNVTPKMHLGI